MSTHTIGHFINKVIIRTMGIKENVQAGTRLDYLEFKTSKKRSTIRTWFWRKGKTILNNEYFDEYLNKFKKDEK